MWMSFCAQLNPIQSACIFYLMQVNFISSYTEFYSTNRWVVLNIIVKPISWLLSFLFKKDFIIMLLFTKGVIRNHPFFIKFLCWVMSCLFNFSLFPRSKSNNKQYQLIFWNQFSFLKENFFKMLPFLQGVTWIHPLCPICSIFPCFPSLSMTINSSSLFLDTN